MTRKFISFALATISLISTAAAQNKLVVHEWGTFTSLQDQTGRAIGAINVDAEPLPDFVHDLLPKDAIPGPPGGKDFPVLPEVTMRLETPVVYFHLPPGASPMQVSFTSEFHGGVLSQFYPNAAAQFDAINFHGLTSQTVSTLSWNDLKVGPHADGPKTDSPIWLAPRQVDAADVTTADNQSERYLFYRGVAHLDSPLKITREDKQVRIAGQAQVQMLHLVDLRVGGLWYFDVQPDGKCAFRKLNPIAIMGQQTITTAADFEPAEYHADSLVQLRADMKSALKSAGLFDDEAEAMLNTWRQSYFQTPGTRVFFIVPRAWIDQQLPIKLSSDAEIQRVMVGRIDLLTPKMQQTAQDYLRKPDQEKLKQLGRFAQPILQAVAQQMASQPHTL